MSPGVITFPVVVQALGAATAVLALRAAYRWWTGSNSSGLPYPPGPKGYPIINNLFDIPMQDPWDLIFFRVFGQPILIVASERRAADLFEKRSTIYSSRPHSVMMHELLEFDNFFAIVDYGPRWRKHRRMFRQEFYPTTIPKYHPTVKRYTQRFLVALSQGEEVSEATRNAIAGMGIRALYGVHVDSINDPFISVASEVGDAFETAGVPGRFLVDVFPILKYVPRWAPGAGFQKWADHYRAASRRVLDEPFEYVWGLHKRGESTPCAATAMIERFSEDPVQRHEESLVARNVCAQTHLAAVDTTYGMMMAFFLAMVLHPRIQRAAQAELDRVVGPFTAPDFGHRPELDYIEAVLRETFRWHQVLPLALPHYVTEDHIYDGYFIPKGTVVFGNSWGLMHDPDVFPEPMEFKPERFLTKDGKLDPNVPEPTALFGYGRRICPGRHFAADMMFSVITATLASYDILPGEDENGNRVKVEPKFQGGAIMKPAPFKCEFQPRSSQVVATLEDLKRTVW